MIFPTHQIKTSDYGGFIQCLVVDPSLLALKGLNPFSLMVLMSQSTGLNIRHLLKAPCCSRGMVRFSCSSLLRLEPALSIQSVLQWRSGSDWMKIKLARWKGRTRFGKHSPNSMSFWNNPKSPMVLRISPKSAMFKN